MQPGIAIPPYDREAVSHLVGLTCRVPLQSGRNGKGWWVDILEVLFVSPNQVAIRCKGCRASGKAKWYNLADVRWKAQMDDPLAQALHRARTLARLKTSPAQS